MAHGVASGSVMRIVARVRWDERSSVLLQFARFRRGTTESRSWAPAYSRPDERSVVVRNRTDGRRRYFRPRNLNLVRSAASLAPVVAIVCCVLRRNKFRFGHAVQAIQGDLLDVEVLADHVGGDADVAQSQCQRIR